MVVRLLKMLCLISAGRVVRFGAILELVLGVGVGWLKGKGLWDVSLVDGFGVRCGWTRSRCTVDACDDERKCVWAVLVVFEEHVEEVL